MTLRLIQTGKYSQVHYDPEHDHFIKTFRPKAEDRLRYAMRLRPYPGHNFALVARRLASFGIASPEITSATRYRLVTRNVHGAPLKQWVQESAELQEQYLDILTTYYHNRIFGRGLHTDNFLVRDGRLVAIDLDAYKLVRVLPYPRQEFLDCLKRSLKGDESFLFARLLERLKLDDDYRPRH